MRQKVGNASYDCEWLILSVAGGAAAAALAVVGSATAVASIAQRNCGYPRIFSAGRIFRTGPYSVLVFLRESVARFRTLALVPASNCPYVFSLTRDLISHLRQLI